MTEDVFVAIGFGATVGPQRVGKLVGKRVDKRVDGLPSPCPLGVGLYDYVVQYVRMDAKAFLCQSVTVCVDFGSHGGWAFSCKIAPGGNGGPLACKPYLELVDEEISKVQALHS